MPFFCIHCRSEIDSKFRACPFCGEEITDFLRQFSENPIDGKYKLLSRLGIGGMGEVFKTLHIHLNAIRVIKVMRPNISNEEGAHDRFLREARLATRIQHPGVATLFDFSTLEDGSRYMVWEYIEGVNLHELIASNGPLSPRYAATIAIQALHGLEAIHRAGIVHRDISPENLMISRTDEGEERVKIIDLGIAKSSSADTEVNKTKTGMFVGKWKYCSPEHLGLLQDNEEIDGRADLYSFGIVLYEMLTGLPPFQAETPHSYLMMHASERPKALRDVNPSVTAAPELEAIIFRALEKNRRDRYGSAREFARALEKVLPSLPEAPGAEAPYPRTAEITLEPTRRRKRETEISQSAETSLTDAKSSPLATVETTGESVPQVPPPSAKLRFVVPAVAAIAAAVVFGMWRSHRSGAPAVAAKTEAPIVAKAAEPPVSSVLVGAATMGKQGRVAMNAFPWAEVTKIHDVSNGKDVELTAPLVTPVPIDLAAGNYEITFTNPAFGKPVRRIVSVEPGREQLVNVTFGDAMSARLPSFGGKGLE